MSKNQITILDVPVSTLAFDAILEKIQKSLKTGQKITTIFTPNPEIVTIARKNRQFLKVIQKFDLALPDGVGLLWAGSVLGKRIQERIAGVDVMEKLIPWCASEGVAVGLIGGLHGVALKGAECLQQQYPRLKIFGVGDFAVDESGVEGKDEKKTLRYLGGSCHPLAPPRSPRSTLLAAATRAGSPADATRLSAEWKSISGKSLNILISQYLNIVNRPAIIFVALGAPKQEFFIENVKCEIRGDPSTSVRRTGSRYAQDDTRGLNSLSRVSNKNPLVLMAVGGAFDVISGRLQRAPSLFQQLHLEWLWRLVQQPWRWKRQLRLVEFVWLVFRKMFS